MDDLIGAGQFPVGSGAGALAMDEQVGARIRRLRTAKGLSLKTVSERSGTSIGMLSLIERGRSSPSVRLLARLADALEVTVAHFIPGDHLSGTREQPVMRVSNRPEISIWRAGITKHVITPTRQGQHGLVLMEVTIEPGGTSGDESYSHEGEEAGVLVEGQLNLVIDKERFLLNEGDGFRFLSSVPHRFSNPSDKVTARVLWVNYRDLPL